MKIIKTAPYTQDAVILMEELYELPLADMKNLQIHYYLLYGIFSLKDR